MSRKLYQMQPELALLAGPNNNQGVQISVSLEDALWLLKHEKPDDALTVARRRDYESDGADEQACRIGSAFFDAVYDWNQAHNEDGDDAYVAGWHWLGLAVRARCEALDVWVCIADSTSHNKSVCTVHVDERVIEGEARKTALEALALLQKLT